MARKLPSGLRKPPKLFIPGSVNRVPPRSENIALDKNPAVINRIATDTRWRGIRNTAFRLPYLSNLRKMDPVFDDPYDVAAQTIRKTRKPGDPDIILDPDGMYEADDLHGNPAGNEETLRYDDPYNEFEIQDRYEGLMAATGMSLKYIRSLMVRPLVTKFVANQLDTGKIFSIYVLTVVGNGDGLVGYGEGKAEEGADANHMALVRAVKAMKPIERYENRTVYGEVDAKFGATNVTLRSRPPGFGIRAHNIVYEVCRCAGINDVSGKVRGSMNGMNIVKATLEALRGQKLPSTIAKQRGVHVIDVRERYFHGR